MNIFIGITIIVCITIVIIVAMYFYSKRPQSTCNHDVGLKEVYYTDKNKEFLSICSKCGADKVYHFGPPY